METVDLVRVLGELISFPSTGGSAAEGQIQHWLAERLSERGLTVDLWPIDLAAVRSDPGYPGEEVDRAQAWGLVGTSRPGEEPALILQGHVDVVPVGDRSAWHSDPFAATIRDGALLGRGACDMKGGVAAILAAVAAVQGQDVPAFSVQLVIGEEDGGIGAFATLARGHRGRACIIPEPTGLELVVANAGSLTFRLEVPGLATHGSTRDAGSSAIDSYLALHVALAELERRRNARPEPLLAHRPIAYPLSVGRVRAGEWASTVPDRLVAEGRYGLRIEEEPAQARAELEQAVATTAERDPYLRDHPPRVTWSGGQFRGGRLPSGHPLAELVRGAHADITGTPLGPERGAPYGSDLRFYAHAGIPTLHYGPGDVRLAHAPNESVPIHELVTTALVLELALRRADGQPAPSGA